MVKTKRGYVLASSLLSGIAATLSLISLGTEQWVVSKGEFTLAEVNNEQLSTIKYGLFRGTFLQQLGGPTYIEIKATCSVSDNACAYLCPGTAELRQDELTKLLRGEQVQIDPSCPRVRVRNRFVTSLKQDGIRRGGQRQFLNAGLYYSTVVFISISALFGLVATVLSVWNTGANPIEAFLSIHGIYIYNCIAMVASACTLVLWGALFAKEIVYNVGILYTIQEQMSTEGYANLGYSYWLNVPSCILYTTSIAILYARQYLISREPEIQIHTTSIEKDIGKIMIY